MFVLCQTLCSTLREKVNEGHLAGSVGGPCYSWSWGHEFKPHVEHGAHFKKIKVKILEWHLCLKKTETNKTLTCFQGVHSLENSLQ